MPAKKAETKDTTVKKGTKSVDETKKTTTRKTVKKTVSKTEAPAKKAAKTKQTTKKAETLKNDKSAVEADKKPAKVKKEAEVKKAPAKKAPAKKTSTKKSAPAKKETKKTVKKDVRAEQYRQFSLDTCIDMAKAMGIDLGYDQYAELLMENSDNKKIVSIIQEQFHLNPKKFSYEEDGYDLDLLPILIEKIADTVDIKASDFVSLGKEVAAHEKYEIAQDALENNEEYNADFDLVKRILMIAQRKDITTMEELKTLIKVDATSMIEKFMDVALTVLKNWQYDDVKYYEGFIYTVLSQFTDLYDAYENRAMMDVADLYIEHGDYGLGDANYNYILRENQIKDYIYFRFANVYKDIDREKSRAIANAAMQFVDDRYDYYPQIAQFLEN